MRLPKKFSRVIVKHSKDCFMRDRLNPWSGLTDGHYCGSIAAREGVEPSDHIWHRVTCNNPKCPAIKAVHFSVLINA
jgi:hypothetical protein